VTEGCRSRFEGSQHLVRPQAAESPILSYKDVQSGFERILLVSKRRRSDRDPLSQDPAKYRPHRPHRYQYSDLQDFLAVGVVVGYRPRAVGYRPFLQIPTAYQPRRNVAICRRFCYIKGAAVDTGDVLRDSPLHGKYPQRKMH
jgi:hypothetical protein